MSTAASLAAQTSPISFRAPKAFSSPNAYGMIGSDLRGNGRQDIAIAGDGGITVRLGDGKGGFSTGHTYITGIGPTQVLAGDFNGDGKPDLAALSIDEVAILPGNGDGTFQPAIVSTQPSGQQLLAFAAGDFDGDGKLDLVLVTSTALCAATVQTLLGNGDATFHEGGVFAIESGDCMTKGSIAAADFNRDGKLDVVFATEWLVATLVGNGDGTFSKGTTLDSDQPTAFAMSVAVADFDGDGIPDIVSSLELSNHSAVAVYLNSGGRSFKRTWVSNDKAGSVIAADFKGNGKPDLALTTAHGIEILPNIGHGEFGHPLRVLTAGGAGPLAAGDFNQDGKLDLAYLDPAGLAVRLGRGTGLFQEPVHYAPRAHDGKPTSLASGDFHGNGKTDIVATAVLGVSKVGDLLMMTANGNGGFQDPMPAATKLAGDALVAVADFNHDGKLDVATAGAGLSISLGNGDGTFSSQNMQTAFTALSVAAADFNGDGNPDLVLSGEGNFCLCLYVMLGNGDGTFQSAVPYAMQFQPEGVAVADLNHDGIPDVVATTSGRLIAVLLGKGDGSFRPARYNRSPLASGTLALGDFNGDGNVDIAVSTGGPEARSRKKPGLSVLLGYGDGTFAAPLVTHTEFTAKYLAAADFNGDGLLDLAAGLESGGVAALAGDGHGGFAQPVLFDAGGGPMILGDFNGDGKPDLAALGNGGVIVMINTTK